MTLGTKRLGYENVKTEYEMTKIIINKNIKVGTKLPVASYIYAIKYLYTTKLGTK